MVWWYVFGGCVALYSLCFPIMGAIAAASAWYHRSRGRQARLLVWHQLLPSKGDAALAVARRIAELLAADPEMKAALVGGWTYGAGYDPKQGERELTPNVMQQQLLELGVNPEQIIILEASSEPRGSVDSGSEAALFFDSLCNSLFDYRGADGAIDIELVGLSTHMFRTAYIYYVRNLAHWLSARRVRITRVHRLSGLLLSWDWLLKEPFRFGVNFVDPLNWWIGACVVRRRRRSMGLLVPKKPAAS